MNNILKCLTAQFIRKSRSWFANLSLANQITLAFTLIYIPVVVSGSLSIERLVKDRLIRASLQQLKLESLITKSILDEWEDAVLRDLRSISWAYSKYFKNPGDAPFKEIDSQVLSVANGGFYVLDIGGPGSRNQPVLSSVRDLGQQGDATTSYQATRLARILKLRSSWLDQSGKDFRQFTSSYFSGVIGKQLLFTAWPIGQPGERKSEEQQFFGVFLLPLSDLVSSTRLDSLDQLLFSGLSIKGFDKAFFVNPLPVFILTGSDGTPLLSIAGDGTLVPGQQFNEKHPGWVRIESQVLRGCPGGLTNTNPLEHCQSRLDYLGESYIVDYRPDAVMESGIGTIAILPLEFIDRSVGEISRYLMAIELMMMAVGIISMRMFSKKLAEPLVDACYAIGQLSRGQFSISLSSRPIGEIRELYASIHETARRLEVLVASEREAAVSMREIETAKGIQRNFLPARISSVSCVDIAALCEPALSVGADWYDVIPLRMGTVFVLADVCDKGVGSALFMSVFRSLIRFFVQEMFIDQVSEVSGDQERLQQVLGKVNAYMAQNHGESSMFATIFLGLHRPTQEKLVVVNGGHEATMLLANGHGDIEMLKASGPAVGIFDGASYTSYESDCPVGSWMLMYSDGLPDACNRDGERFGHDRTEQCFRNAITQPGCEGQSTAQEVLQEIRSNVSSFCGDTPAFDDLTVMVVFCQDPATESSNSADTAANVL